MQDSATVQNCKGSDLVIRALGKIPLTWASALGLAAALAPMSPVFAQAAASAPAIAKPTLTLSTLPHGLSPWAMFVGADGVVKSVIVLLVLASVLTWTVWLAKSVELSRSRKTLRQSSTGLDDVATLAEIGDRKCPVVATMVGIASKEMSHTVPESIKERLAVRLQRVEAAAARRARRGLTLLASIGATAPFVGLFGTVWGIMNSFIGISEAQTTNLAVVAPGIAEALLATGLGLVAAIPAVLIYNSFTRSVAGYKAMVADVSTQVICIVSRELDRRSEERPAVEHRRAVAVR
jgi:biopolymer transport protein ExbB